jgi:predicted O-methyltransferase YrrM
LFDIIIVDGILRDDCLETAMNKISEGGMLILDNADRHPEASKKYRDNGYTQIDFHGLGPINEYAWTTSIFFKTLQFSPISIQPTVPIGGGY